MCCADMAFSCAGDTKSAALPSRGKAGASVSTRTGASSAICTKEPLRWRTDSELLRLPQEDHEKRAPESCQLGDRFGAVGHCRHAAS